MKNNWIWAYIKYEIKGLEVFLCAQKAGWIFFIHEGACNLFWVTNQIFTSPQQN